jgi:hypothetical protein
MVESRNMKRLLEHLLPALFFCVLIVIGLLIYKDFGIPWDETAQIQIGTVNFRYIFNGDPGLFSLPDRYYGSIFEIPLLWVSARLFIPRHFAIFLIFCAGLILFFLLSRRLFHNTWWGLIASAILVTSPRFFADAFYNSKDIPFLTTSIFAILTLVLLSDGFINKLSWREVCFLLVLHSGASAVSISTRVVGIVIIPLTLYLFLFQILKSPVTWKSQLIILFGYLVLTIGLTILFWPILWNNPWGEFLNAFNKMSSYPFGRMVLYQGAFVAASNLPWHYLPVWIGITTPLIVLAGIVPGIFRWIGSLFNAIKWFKSREKFTAIKSMDSDIFVWPVITGWLAIPIVSIYIFHSVLYDGWRHMYFIYPAIVLISLRGLQVLYEWLLHRNLKSNGIRIVAALFMLIGLVEPILFMVRYHPHENVYFNVFAGDPSTLRQRFELDYWGLSYKQAIDFILKNDSGQNIKIFVANPPGRDYINGGLPEEQKARLILVDDPVNANYFVSEFRWHPDDYPYANEIYSINIRGTKIMVVYRLH